MIEFHIQIVQNISETKFPATALYYQLLQFSLTTKLRMSRSMLNEH